jgi:tRNA modification GTPase
VVLERIFRFADSRKYLREVKPNTIHYGFIFDENEKLDEVLVMLMRAPHTYTAEDTVEIDCHGGIYVMQKILALVLRNGARLAEPGEFTKRAFLNGRIDLSEAEAVMDVIASGSDDALESSLMQLGGSVRRVVEDARERIIAEAAFIEAALDDPEHMDLTGYSEALYERIRTLRDELVSFAGTFDQGKILREGIATVILGKPNAGKSSLLNCLTGEERAIVTDIAGTTRDTLEENIRLGGMMLRVADTAGIRATDDVIEKIGVERALKMAGHADLILALFDSSLPLTDEDEEILRFIEDKKALVLLNKTDLAPVTTAAFLRERAKKPVIEISAKMREGIGELEKSVRELFFAGGLRLNEQTVMTNIRHKEAVTEAAESLALVLAGIDNGLPEDFYTVDLMDAYASLGRIIGEEVGDDIVDAVFTRFCMGK